MIKRTLILIDGENLVFRYQDLLRQGRIPRKEVIHIPDVFVWSPHIYDKQCLDIIRVNYYTSCVGDEMRLDEIKRQIQAISYQVSDAVYTLKGRLIPKVFKKLQKSNKSRLVDIQITLDALVAAYTTNNEEFHIITGDADFIVLIEQLMRIGKRVHVYSLSSGLGQRIDLAPDHFELVDSDFFEPIEQQHTA